MFKPGKLLKIIGTIAFYDLSKTNNRLVALKDGTILTILECKYYNDGIGTGYILSFISSNKKYRRLLSKADLINWFEEINDN